MLYTFNLNGWWSSPNRGSEPFGFDEFGDGGLDIAHPLKFKKNKNKRII